MALTQQRIDSTPIPATGRQKLYDGDGLFLVLAAPARRPGQTPGKGTRLWRFRYFRPTLDGKKETLLSLGAYPETSLAAARTAAARLLAEIKKGGDPAAARRDARDAVVEAKAMTFLRAAEEYVAKAYRERSVKTVRKAGWYIANVRRIHPRPIGEITAPELVAVLESIEHIGDRRETAHRVSQFLNRVFRFAVQKGYRETNPAANMRGVLLPVKQKNHPAIVDPRQFGQLCGALALAPPGTRNALRLIALTALRPGELRAAEWSEFRDLDGERPEWVVPAHRMKMKRQHLVPLSRQAVAVLKEQREISGDLRYTFPSGRSSRRPLSDGGMNAALQMLGYTTDQHRPHGFRSSFSTLLNGELRVDSALVELQLAHAKRDVVAGIYDRSQRVEERRELMQAWADYIDKLKAIGNAERSDWLDEANI